MYNLEKTAAHSTGLNWEHGHHKSLEKIAYQIAYCQGDPSQLSSWGKDSAQKGSRSAELDKNIG